MTTTAVKDYLEITDLQARLRISNPTARKLASQLGRKVGRGWRVSAEKLKRYIEQDTGAATNTDSIKTSAASGGATSIPFQTDASSVLAGRQTGRRRRSGAPRSRSMRGARRGSAKRRQ